MPTTSQSLVMPRLGVVSTKSALGPGLSCPGQREVICKPQWVSRVGAHRGAGQEHEQELLLLLGQATMRQVGVGSRGGQPSAIPSQAPCVLADSFFTGQVF